MDGLCDSEDSTADGEITGRFTGKSNSVSELLETGSAVFYLSR